MRQHVACAFLDRQPGSHSLQFVITREHGYRISGMRGIRCSALPQVTIAIPSVIKVQPLKALST